MPTSRRLRISVRPISRLSEREYRQCRRLTLGTRGSMMDELTRAYSRQDDHQVIQMRDQNRRLVGWSLLLPPGASSNPVTQVQIYVRARDRRRGVGRRLLRRAMRIAGNVEVCPWDHTSAAFYGPYIDRRRVKCASGYFA